MADISELEDFQLRWGTLYVRHLIYESEKSFIVFLDKNIDVDWKTSDSYDEKGPQDPKKHNEVLNRAATIECIPNEHHSNSIRVNFKRMIGEGVARSLCHDYDNAERVLGKAENYINNRNIETARFWQLRSGLVLGVCFIPLAIIIWLLRSSLLIQLGETTFFALLSACSGGLGAALSLIFRIGKSQITSEAEQKLHVLEATSRIFGGAISGLLISFLVKLRILVPIFNNASNTHIAMVTAALIAGASERWIPSLIARIENPHIGEKEKTE